MRPLSVSRGSSFRNVSHGRNPMRNFVYERKSKVVFLPLSFLWFLYDRYSRQKHIVRFTRMNIRDEFKRNMEVSLLPGIKYKMAYGIKY